MTSPAEVTVGWAVWGKRPGTNEDYSILASSSEPLSKAEYASIVAHFAPGTPPVERGLPGSLPWVTFSQVGVEGQPYLGISVQDLISQVDGVGRPIAQTSYFCAPYTDLIHPPVTCYGLYQAVAGLSLPGQAGPPARLAVSPLDPPAIAAIIRKLGLELVATTASLLLDGPVTITGAEGAPLNERLRFIDAVAALLPFAYRAGYTAATWSDNGAGQRIRLAFSSRSQPGTASVKWQSPSAPMAADGPARVYLTRLGRVLGRSNVGDPLTELIRSLAAQAEPARKFDEPRYALDCLRELDLPSLVLDAARDGTVKPDEIRLVFASGRITELPAASRRKLLEKLIALGEPQDWKTIGQWFDSVAGPDPDDLLGTVASTCRRLLWSPAGSPLIREYLILAAHYGWEDELLAKLMAPPKSAEDLGHGMGAAARLLAESALTTRTSAAGYPQTQQALKKNPTVACQLLVQLSGSESGTGAAISWIEPVLGDFLRPFIDVLDDTPHAVDPRAVGQLAARGVSWIRALLQAASYGNRLEYAVPGFASWLAASVAEKGAPDKPTRQYWQNTVGALTARTAVTQAWLDISLLLTGNDPLFLLADQEDRARFTGCFVAAWQQLAAGAEITDGRLTADLADYLSRRPWTARVELAAAVADLAERLTSGGRRHQLEVVVARMLSAAPGAANWEFAAKWLARMETIRPGSVESLRYMAADATPAQIAESCARVAQKGALAADAGRALADSHVIESGAQAAEVLEALRQALPGAATGPVNPTRWLTVFIELFTDGAFGDRVAREFPELSIGTAFDEIRYRLGLLRVTASGGQQEQLPALSEADIEELEKIRKLAGDIVRDAKKRNSRGPFRRSGKPSTDPPDAPS